MGQGCRRHGTNPVRTDSVSSPVALPTWCHVRHKTPPAICLFITHNYCMSIFLDTHACGCAWWRWDSHGMFAGVRGLLWSWHSPAIALAMEMKLQLSGSHHLHLACREAPPALPPVSASTCPTVSFAPAYQGSLLAIETLLPVSWPQQILWILPCAAPYWNAHHKVLGWVFFFLILNRGLMM